MGISERYHRNLGVFAEEELALVRAKSACVVGCGGLGGYVSVDLARFGVGKLTLIDGDNFCASNLNRQLFSTELNLGQNKAVIAMEELKNINSEVTVTAHQVMLDKENAPELLKGHDIIIDCLDNIATRRILAKTCAVLEIPLVHGAVSGLYGQVACIYPEDGLMDILYPSGYKDSLYKTAGNPIFVPQLIASIQSCEAVKLLAGRQSDLRSRVLYADMMEHDYEIVEFLSDK